MKYILLTIVVLFLLGCDRPEQALLYRIETNYAYYTVHTYHDYDREFSHFDTYIVDGKPQQRAVYKDVYKGTKFRDNYYPEMYRIYTVGFNKKEKQISENFLLESLPGDYILSNTIKIRETNRNLLFKDWYRWRKEIFTGREVYMSGRWKSDVERDFNIKHLPLWLKQRESDKF